MQDYTYSVFSGVAIVIHLIINYQLLIGRREGIGAARVVRYRGFLLAFSSTTLRMRRGASGAPSGAGAAV